MGRVGDEDADQGFADGAGWGGGTQEVEVLEGWLGGGDGQLQPRVNLGWVEHF